MINNVEEENEEEVERILEESQKNFYSKQVKLKFNLLRSAHHYLMRNILFNPNTPPKLLKRIILDYMNMGEDEEDKQIAKNKIIGDIFAIVNIKNTINFLSDLNWTLVGGLYKNLMLSGGEFQVDLDCNYQFDQRTSKKRTYARLIYSQFEKYLSNRDKEAKFIEILTREAKKNINNVEVILWCLLITDNEETDPTQKFIVEYLLQNCDSFNLYQAHPSLLAEVSEKQANFYVFYLKFICKLIEEISKSFKENWVTQKKTYLDHLLNHLFKKSDKLHSTTKKIINSYFEKEDKKIFQENVFNLFPYLK